MTDITRRSRFKRSSDFCLTAIAAGLLFTAQFAQGQTQRMAPRAIPPAVAAQMSIEQQSVERFKSLLRTNPEIATSKINQNASEFVKDSAQSAFYPKISVGANASSSSTTTNRQSTDITVRQPVYTAGRLTARMDSAESEAVIADAEFNKTVQDVVLDGMLAHSALSRNALLVDASRAAVTAVAELLALEEKRVQLGGSGITDAQFARARLAVTQDRLANYEGQFQEAQATYFRYFGAYPQGYAIPELEVTREMLPAELGDAVTKGVFANPSIRIAESEIVKARHNFKAEKASMFPSLEVVGIQQFFGEEDPITGKKSDSSVNLRLSYSAFSGGEQQARVNQAAATIDTRRAQLAAARLRVEESVRFQWGKWFASNARASTLRQAQGDSLQVFKNRKRLRDFGRETVIVMLDAQVEYFNVLIAYINAVFDARDAGIRLMHAMGQFYPTPGSEGAWFKQFFSSKPERKNLEKSLQATEDIASSASDSEIAEKLGINVDSRSVREASKFVLTPTQRLQIRQEQEQANKLRNSEIEKELKPTLRTAPGLDPRFYK